MSKSVLLSRRVSGTDVPSDQVFVIYGAPGSGKTTLARTFPKTKDAPMLYIDILEGGSKVISKKDLELIDNVSIDTFEELDSVLNDVYNGYAIDDAGKKVPIKYSTIVIDTITNLEYILKEHIKQAHNKSDMTLQLWGKARDNSEFIFNLLKKLHQKTSFFTRSFVRYYSSASLIASVGHTSVQEPQSVHFSGSTTYLSSPSLMASAGHSSAQRPQLIHSSLIT